MHDYLSQIDNAVDLGLYYVALMSALAIPDIFGALEQPSGEASRDEYVNWFDTNMPTIYTTPNKWTGEPLFPGLAAYAFRSSMLHQAKTGGHPRGYERVMFYEPGHSNNVFHLNVVDDYLNIDVSVLCRDLTDAARTWLTSHEANPVVQTNLASSIRRYPEGFGGMSGVPVIA